MLPKNILSQDMKALAIGLIRFAIFPILFILCFDMYLRSLDSSYSAKYEQLMELNDKIDVLVLGNSHATFGVDPRNMPDFNVFNLANGNQHIYFDKRLTEKAISEGVDSLDYVLISTDLHSLFNSTQGNRNIWSYYKNGIKYKNERYLKADLSPFIWGYTPFVSMKFLNRDLRARIFGGDQLRLCDLDNTIDRSIPLYNGSFMLKGTDESKFSEEELQKKIKVFREDTLRSERKEVLQDLTGFIEYLQDKGIQPILFSAPTYTEFNELVDPNQIKRNKRDIDYLCTTYDLDYWRFEEDPRFHKEDFHDADHLNSAGAAKFSRILNERLKTYDEERKSTAEKGNATD